MLSSGANEQGRIVLGIAISKELKDIIIRVSMSSDWVMCIKLGREETLVNIMCANAPQVGFLGEEQYSFWRCMDHQFSTTSKSER